DGKSPETDKTLSKDKTPTSDKASSTDKTSGPDKKLDSEKPPKVDKSVGEKEPSVEKAPLKEKTPSEPPLELTVDRWQKIRSRGGELYYTDAALRTVFARDNPGILPEAKRKLPDASARTFDWSTLIKRERIHDQKANPLCWAFAAVTAFEWNWVVRNGG